VTVQRPSEEDALEAGPRATLWRDGPVEGRWRRVTLIRAMRAVLAEATLAFMRVVRSLVSAAMRSLRSLAWAARRA